jgi:hypothetical protein
MRDASDDVVSGEVGLLRVGVAQPGGDHPEHHERRPRSPLEEGGEGRAGHEERVDRLERGHGRGARLVVDR